MMELMRESWIDIMMMPYNFFLQTLKWKVELEQEKQKKLKELKLELIKSKAKSSSQGTSSKTREIKKAIARLLTIK